MALYKSVYYYYYCYYAYIISLFEPYKNIYIVCKIYVNKDHGQKFLIIQISNSFFHVCYIRHRLAGGNVLPVHDCWQNNTTSYRLGVFMKFGIFYTMN